MVLEGRLRARQWAAIAGGSLALFGLLSLDIVFNGLVARLDAAVSAWVLDNLDPGTRRDVFEVFVSAAGGWPVSYFAAGAFALAIGLRRPLWGFVYLGTAYGTKLAVAGLKLLFARPRPDPGLTESLAYPSGHSAAAAVTFALAALLLVRVYGLPRRWAAWGFGVAVAVALVTGIGRILAGVHYPGDVLGGFLLGVAATAIVLTAWKAGVDRVRAAHEERKPGQTAQRRDPP